MATCAVHTSAARAALALAFVLSSRGIHSNGVHIAVTKQAMSLVKLNAIKLVC